jgi:hypothetical protein
VLFSDIQELLLDGIIIPTFVSDALAVTFEGCGPSKQVQRVNVSRMRRRFMRAFRRCAQPLRALGIAFEFSAADSTDQRGNINFSFRMLSIIFSSSGSRLTQVGASDTGDGLMIAPMRCLKGLWTRLTKATRHRTTSVDASWTTPLTSSLQASAVRTTTGGGEDISVRRVNWPDRGTSTEIDTAKRFSRLVGNGLSRFIKMPENDDVDIKGESAGGAIFEECQVTRLWDGKFWTELNSRRGATDRELTTDELCKLVLDAARRKATLYSPARRKMLVLLIDAAPEGVLPHIIPRIRSSLKADLDRIDFKQVWLVGPGEEEHLR